MMPNAGGGGGVLGFVSSNQGKKLQVLCCKARSRDLEPSDWRNLRIKEHVQLKMHKLVMQRFDGGCEPSQSLY
jgi:hypothetical protein